MSREKQIEEMSCKRCVHYDVCMYVNAKAVEVARTENCKFFKDNAGYRKQIESEWIVTTKTDVDCYTQRKVAQCKNCGSEMWFKSAVKLKKYCPDCGAKMKGGAE